MRFLLDTHIWLWFVLGSDQLPKRWRALLEDENNELWLSPISVWEALVLAERNRVQLDPDPETWIAESFTLFSFREAKLNREIAILSRQLRFAHQDPADRFIAATAKFNELTLMTMDKQLRHCKEITTVPLKT